VEQSNTLGDDDAAAHALNAPLVLVDTAGCGAEEMAEEEGASWYNEIEVECVVGVARELLEGGVKGDVVGVITPYSAQKSKCVSQSPLG
jgi:superfamily I DNA and/or RNA helicase